jgi:hypothetical protein
MDGGGRIYEKRENIREFGGKKWSRQQKSKLLTRNEMKGRSDKKREKGEGIF